MTENLIAGRRSLSAREEKLCLRRLTAGHKFVVTDVETTGLDHHARVISAALIELRNNKKANSWSSHIDPKIERIGATRIHGLTRADLNDAPTFLDVVGQVTQFLTPAPSTQVVLVGHNVRFDHTRLAYEYRLAGHVIPDVLLLDTAVLAQAAGMAVGNNKLATLTEALGVTNNSPHSADEDASVTALVCIELLGRLAHYGVEDLAGLLRAPSDQAEMEDDPFAAEVDDEHRNHHSMELTLSDEVRDEALAYCLSKSCDELPYRIEDAISATSPVADARALASWALARLSDLSLSRVQAGLLAGGLSRTLRHFLRTPAEVTGHYNKHRATLAALGPCTKKAACNRCTVERTCHFLTLQESYVNAYLHNDNGVITAERVTKFIPLPTAGKKGPGAPVIGWFGNLVKAGDTHAAAHGAAVCARVRRKHDSADDALATTALAWKKGLRTAELGLLYSKLLEQVTPTVSLTTLRRGRAVCAASATGYPFHHSAAEVQKRIKWLDRRIDYRAGKHTSDLTPGGKAKTVVGPYNTRSVPDSRYRAAL